MLTLQFGQCGNQLGHSLFSKISEDIGYARDTGVSYDTNYQYNEDSVPKWFNYIIKDNKLEARAILVDTEEKVIHKTYSNFNQTWSYSQDNIICERDGGSANNWAYGYLNKGPALSELILNRARCEIEKLDHFNGFLLLLSCAGGTGSGVGSRILEVLREEYNKEPIVTTAILPFLFGEVATQNYNILLSISKFLDKADTILLFENEQIHKICQQFLKIHDADIHDMNDIIAKKLTSILQPVNDSSFNLNSLALKISAHPSYKIATIKSVPYITEEILKFDSINNWESYIQYLKKTLRISNPSESGVKTKSSSTSINNIFYDYECCVSNILITRGGLNKNESINTLDMLDNKLYADWTMSDRFTHLHHNRKMFKQEKFLSLITNNSQVSKTVETILSKAWISYTHSSYLHQYKQFGIDENDFLQSFAKIENLIKNYKELNNIQ